MRQISLTQLFDDNRAKLQLVWVGGRPSLVVCRGEGSYGAGMIGYLTFIHPERVQVIGRAEIAWMQRMPAERVQRDFEELFAASPPGVVVADDLPPPDLIADLCRRTETPLMCSPKPAAAVIDTLLTYLSRRLADSVSVHGVMIDVLGMGVLVMGDSGVGKSELALELISRGHGLVADDVVDIHRVAPGTLEGRCPELLLEFLEVRGLGLLNIRTIFGETALRRKMKLNLVVHLQKPAAGAEMPRLPLGDIYEEILGVPVHKVFLPVAAGRNLAVLLEAAVRNTILKLRGIDSMKDFVDRQQRLMQPDDGSNVN